MDYKQCKQFAKRLRKLAKITDSAKRAQALSGLTQDMRQNGFELPRLYRRTTTTVMQLLKEEMEKGKNGKFSKSKHIWLCIRISAIVLGVVASIITIIWFIIHFFL